MTVDVSTADGTATAGIDYVAISNRKITIPAGLLSAVVSVTVRDDSDVESDETFTLSISNPTVASLGTPATATATIRNDDLPEVTVSDAPDTQEGSALVFAVNLSAASASDVTVNVSTAGSTARVLPPADFRPPSSRVTIPAGTTSVNISVVTIDDTDYELTKTVKLTLSSPSGATLGSPSVATGLILDNDEPRISIVGPSGAVAEDANGTANVLYYTMWLDSTLTREATVSVTTSSGTATGGTCGTTGADYAHKSATVKFSPGARVRSFTVTTCPDAVAGEGTEDFTVTLSNPTNAMLGTATATGEITDTDGNAVSVSITGPSTPVDEEDTNDASNSVVFTVRLDVAYAREVTVTASTTAGTATSAPCASGGDFFPRSMTVRFSPGDAVKSFIVRTCPDSVPELDETFTATISSPTVAVLGTPTTATATITDNDDSPVTVSFGQASYTAAEGGAATVTVALSAAPGRTVTIPIVATDQGGATSGDYSGVPGSVTFDAAEMSTTFTFTAVDDTDDDDDESVKLNFGVLPNAVSAGTPSETTIAITDDGWGL